MKTLRADLKTLTIWIKQERKSETGSLGWVNLLFFLEVPGLGLFRCGDLINLQVEMKGFLLFAVFDPDEHWFGSLERISGTGQHLQSSTP